jgi:hypothetical protein
MLQIIDFSGLCSFFNVKFDLIMQELLETIQQVTQMSILQLPTGDKINSIDNSEASTYKGKLTDQKLQPYILQNIQYTDLLMIFCFFMELIYFLMRKQTPTLILQIGTILFEALFIDQLILVYRTLGAYAYDKQKDFYDNLSLLVALSILLIQFHMIFKIYKASKDFEPHNAVDKQTNKHPEFIHKMMYEFINLESLNKSWLARYYHQLYLLRFSFVAVFVINAQ